ncbi:hypothetical protein DFH94DRAFT_683397 [Russula ochroleuca]|uniref:Uncharacterized protein n=1 Tax=Russula ochroleuca TaxID=152965 RepID=A0A9P5MSH4_9AGAM|nr:hypothetical protein DFH94DRAFT_683397 [Russula ochroleuca]
MYCQREAARFWFDCLPGPRAEAARPGTGRVRVRVDGAGGRRRQTPTPAIATLLSKQAEEDEPLRCHSDLASGSVLRPVLFGFGKSACEEEEAAVAVTGVRTARTVCGMASVFWQIGENPIPPPSYQGPWRVPSCALKRSAQESGNRSRTDTIPEDRELEGQQGLHHNSRVAL